MLLQKPQGIRQEKTLQNALPLVSVTAEMLGTYMMYLWFRGLIVGGSLSATGRSCWLVLCLSVAFVAPHALSQQALTDEQLLLEVQRRAVLFFSEHADTHTGLISDRAKNDGTVSHIVASIASTGYGLAALPVAVENKWLSRDEAARTAAKTLKFALEGLQQEHGWFYRFVDKRTGQRIWESELSSIDTALFILGTRVCARYFDELEIRPMADALYNRLDWTWMRTNGDRQTRKLVVSHGWTPEEGFLKWDWGAFSEGVLLYLLGLGAERDPLPPECWEAWNRKTFRYGDAEALDCGPIFTHQMTHGFFPLKDLRDRLGYDYWMSSVNATRIQRQFCIDHAKERKTYGPDIWGLNASDGPKVYTAYGVPGPEDGTVSPTGAISSIVFTPDLSIAAARHMHQRFGDKLWGRYGFGNALNADTDWYGPDVIGIDLGMALLAIENHRSGLIWRLMKSDPLTDRAYAAAGLRQTVETASRPLHLNVAKGNSLPIELGVGLPLLPK